MIKHPAASYAEGVIEECIRAPKYVKIQCREFLSIFRGESEIYCINTKLLKKIYVILKLLKMAKGPKAGQSIYKSLAGYQWLLITAVIGTVYREDKRKRRYQTALLEICRKNGKTFVVAVLFILLFYLEPSYSRFFSVAPDGALAREIKEAIEPLIQTNAAVFEKGEFKILRDYILHRPTKTKYTPLNYSTTRMDGKEPSVFIADEVGALPTPYAIEAMRSGQLLVKNKLGFIISTKYPTVHNPLEDEVQDAKMILDGLVEDPTVFALLYEPDNPDDWATDDDVLKDGNPLAQEIEEVWDDLVKKREKAIRRESLRENFLTKHCNIVYQGQGTETYVEVEKVRACKIDHIDWEGMEVYIGVDLAMSNDNCAVAMSAEMDGEIYSDVIAFIPEGRIDEKNEFEHIDYRRFIQEMKCIACGDMTVDYSVIEDFVFGIEEKYGVTVRAIGYDRYNALSSAQKWNEKYETVEIRQHSDTLHPPTKLLYEYILNRQWHYTENILLEINFENAKCTFDTNMNRYVNKKKSSGKVDEVAAIINSIYLLQQNVLLYDGDFVVQTA
ncbi:terminase TerL endonuclease subunit [Anaerostipes butyraticus]|uniref:terminase TerL endonuclease subunit n=1 Tax=Anaerostipes butyraticus TaxID=645466 RepID=UPI003209896E